MPPPDASTRRTVVTGTLGITLFWVALAAALFAVFRGIESHQRAGLTPYTTLSGELVIARQADGHFYVDGEVNHVPVRFLVDTGASAVSVSDEQAQQAQLPPGQPITLQTANGERPGRLIYNIPVRVGPLSANDTTVVAGLVGLPPQQALLGQSFLRQFDVQLREHDMVLRSRPQNAPVNR